MEVTVNLTEWDSLCRHLVAQDTTSDIHDQSLFTYLANCNCQEDSGNFPSMSDISAPRLYKDIGMHLL